MPRLNKVLRELTPPLLYRAGKQAIKTAARGRANPTPALPSKPQTAAPSRKRNVPGSERDAAFYDDTFDKADHWKAHYTRSRYYPLWTVVADRLKSKGASSILDIGCGPGQVACLMRDTPGIKRYLGLDFSAKRIAQAKKVCCDFDFANADVFKTDLIETANYDAALVMEFLEHINEDLAVLKRIKSGTYVLATVPNFGAPQHVRFFETIESVKSRYEGCFTSIQVDEILGNDRGSKFFLLEGHIT